MTNPSSSSTTTTILPGSSSFSFPTVKSISQELSLKLTGNDNFLLWKTQVLPVLRSHKLLCLIDGNVPQPIDSSDLVQWDRGNQMVLGWLLVSLSPAVLAQVVDKSSTREAWLTLEQVYGTSTRSRIQQLKTDLQTLQKGSKSIHEYLQTAKSLSLSLASVGKGVDEEDLILWTLRGLGSEFDPIVAAINLQPICPSFPVVSGMLLDFELRLTPPTPPSAAAFSATTTPLLPTPSFPPATKPIPFGRFLLVAAKLVVVGILTDKDVVVVNLPPLAI